MIHVILGIRAPAKPIGGGGIPTVAWTVRSKEFADID
jgi:hypothetical protein